ncbi:hypothetical protein AB4166_10375 [Vibrio splendidus]|uniref:hypothetical protein n=1 Tax=Vibrio splendidus TaxID=29497 RepID=UPI001E4ADA43|nr:hypothetical protein [Vibrio splendidus]MCC4863319.1 hypothetical protein [Vibrio splendidus]
MDSLMIAVVTGVISSVATVAAIKVDISWIKQTQVQFRERLEKLEAQVRAIEKGRK